MTSALKWKKLKINVAKPGVSLDLGTGINCDIIAPLNTHYDEINHYSAVVKLSFGSRKFCSSSLARLEKYLGSPRVIACEEDRDTAKRRPELEAMVSHLLLIVCPNLLSLTL
jgi:hypothetical protein